MIQTKTVEGELVGMAVGHDAAGDMLVARQANDAEIRPYSDGRLWDETTAEAEIRYWRCVGVRAMYEIGRRLVWAKKQLGHGAFSDFLEKMEINERNARYQMEIARFFVQHPRALRNWGELDMRRTLELAQADPEVIEAALDTGSLGDVPLDKTGRIPFPELKAKLREAEKKLRQTETALTDSERARTEAEGQVKSMVRLRHSPDRAAEIQRRATELRDQMAGLLAEMGMFLDGVGTSIRRGWHRALDACLRRDRGDALPGLVPVRPDARLRVGPGGRAPPSCAGLLPAGSWPSPAHLRRSCRARAPSRP